MTLARETVAVIDKLIAEAFEKARIAANEANVAKDGTWVTKSNEYYDLCNVRDNWHQWKGSGGEGK